MFQSKYLLQEFNVALHFSSPIAFPRKFFYSLAQSAQLTSYRDFAVQCSAVQWSNKIVRFLFKR